MNYLLFKLNNKAFQYAIVSSEVLYLLNEEEYGMLRNAGHQDILKEVYQLKKAEILKLITFKKEKEVVIFDLENVEINQLNFQVPSDLRKFVQSFSGFERVEMELKARISPINALLLMLFTYSFIWAGTRPNPSDINPEGIRLKLAYWVVQFQEWLNSLIGQKQLLYIGILLLFILIYFIFRPELSKLFRNKIEYLNTDVER